ncbi:MAG: hypothetical protein LBV60_01595 [Streptomyces sp.]|jgi:hypothetical protein|nr:hypothetical protein [Streptomyces sp.]
MNTCGLCEHHAVDGYLCPGCTLATARRLDAAPRWYAALEAFLQPAVTGPAESSRSSRTTAPLPVAEPVLNLRGPGGIVGVLEDWRSAMQADRGWSEPAVTGDTAHRVLAAARALSLNLDWIAGSWPAAGDMAQDVRRLEQDVRTVVAPTPAEDRPVRRGLCPVVPHDQDEPCGAVLLQYPGESTITCRWCGSTWPPSRLLQLARAQHDLTRRAVA